MSTLSRRAQNRRDQQNRILSAALRVFSEAGFHGASMDEVAAAAGLSKPTLYNHFASKDALFQAMMLAQRDQIMAAFDVAPDGDLVEKLYEFAWAYARTVMHPDFLALARLTIGAAQRFPDVGREYQASGPDKVLAGLIDFLRTQRALGRLHFEDAELAAEDFWGLILSAPRNRALHVPDTDISTVALARFIHNGLRTFLRAYSTDPKRDLMGLSKVIAPRAH